ncbi:MAG TPA: IucA/IucC family protein [Candidatus Dormibacteraeota bacterium]|nr:IucA/IucC family protein [Candidatus Dormibacteraeota bacterium]
MIADQAAVEALLRCWIRETGVGRPAHDTLELQLSSTGNRLGIPVRHWSSCGTHRFGPVKLETGHAVTAPLLAALFAAEAGAAGTAGDDLVAGVADSLRRSRRYLEERGRRPRSDGDDPFIAAEQALLLGHPLHPSPKSREGLTDAEDALYGPELRGRFRLRWFAADARLVASDSAAATADEILRRLARMAPPPGTCLVPVHPRQAAELETHPEVLDLIESGRLRDLGLAGEPWSATSSLRTVHRPRTPWMLKLSLGIRITNSRRVHLRKELLRGAEVARMLDAGLGRELAVAHPGFRIVRDPAWVAVEGAPGMETVIRENPFPGGERSACVAGLLAPGPDAGPSRLGEMVWAVASRGGRTRAEVATDWLRRYVRLVIRPILWLAGFHGLVLEAHQQNTLVALDGDGWPVGGWYRDNQGYYFPRSRLGDLARWTPRPGESSDTVCDDEVAAERFGYYVGINNLLGLVGAMGAEGLADERDLLRAVRGELEDIASGCRPPSLVAELLEAPRLRCKANLLTRAQGLDELTAPLETQSVYVSIENPLQAVRR